MRFRCNLCSDLKQSPPVWFEWEGLNVCPKCKATGPRYVVALCDVHFLIEDERGAVPLSAGRGRIVCQPRRDVLAAHTHDMFSASADPRAVTCRRCRKSQQFRERAAVFEELAQTIAAERAGKVWLDKGG